MAEDIELAKKRAIARAKAKLAVQQKEAAAAQATNDQYTQISAETQPVDPWAEQMATPSEQALDVGTSESKKALLRNTLQGMTLGGADEVEAALRSMVGDRTYGEILDDIQMQRRMYAAEKPKEALLQELSGAAVIPNIVKAPASIQKAGTTARAAYEVGTPSAVYGFMGTDGDLGSRAQGAITTGALGVVTGATLNKLGNKVIQLAKNQKETPTVEGLKRLEDAAWQKVDLDQPFFGKSDVTELLNRASGVAQKFNYVTLKNAPTSVERARAMIESIRGKVTTLGQVKQLRTNLYNLANKADDAQGAIVSGMADELGSMMKSKLAAIGDETLIAANNATTNAKRAETLQKAFDKVPADANPYKAYRRAAEKILKDESQARWFTADQRKMLQDFVDGTVSSKVMNAVGRMAPNANGLLGLFHIAAIGVNPYIAILSLAGVGAKTISDKTTRNSLGILVKRMGGIDQVRKLAADPTKATATQAALAKQLNDFMFGKEEEGGNADMISVTKGRNSGM